MLAKIKRNRAELTLLTAWKKNGGQGQNRTADTGIFSLSFKLPIYINQSLIVIISVSHFTFKNKGLAN